MKSVLMSLFLLALLSGCATSPNVPLLSEIKQQCQKPTVSYLTPTPGPAFSDSVTYGDAILAHERWSAALLRCNLDKKAIKDEFNER